MFSGLNSPKSALGTYFPADRVQRFNLFIHVLFHVKTINDRIDFESHSVIPTPHPQFLKIFHMVLLSLTPSNKDIDLLIEAVTGDGKNVQIFTCRKNGHLNFSVKEPSLSTCLNLFKIKPTLFASLF